MKKLNFITILVRIIVAIPILLFLILMTEYSKIVLPPSGINALIRYGLFIFLCKEVVIDRIIKKIYIGKPSSMNIKKIIKPNKFIDRRKFLCS